MTDKELIKQEIESYRESMKGLEPHSDFRRGQITAYNQIMQFINSLPEEHNDDLEEEIDKCWEGWIDPNPEVKGVDGYLSKDEFSTYARHFAEWQKQQWMKDAVECTWGSQATSAFMSDYPNIDIGEKVKIIILKTE